MYALVMYDRRSNNGDMTAKLYDHTSLLSLSTDVIQSSFSRKWGCLNPIGTFLSNIQKLNLLANDSRCSSTAAVFCVAVHNSHRGFISPLENESEDLRA